MSRPIRWDDVPQWESAVLRGIREELYGRDLSANLGADHGGEYRYGLQVWSGPCGCEATHLTYLGNLYLVETTVIRLTNNHLQQFNLSDAVFDLQDPTSLEKLLDVLSHRAGAGSARCLES